MTVQCTQSLQIYGQDEPGTELGRCGGVLPGHGGSFDTKENEPDQLKASHRTRKFAANRPVGRGQDEAETLSRSSYLRS